MFLISRTLKFLKPTCHGKMLWLFLIWYTTKSGILNPLWRNVWIWRYEPKSSCHLSFRSSYLAFSVNLRKLASFQNQFQSDVEIANEILPCVKEDAEPGRLFFVVVSRKRRPEISGPLHLFFVSAAKGTWLALSHVSVRSSSVPKDGRWSQWTICKNDSFIWLICVIFQFQWWIRSQWMQSAFTIF